MAGRLIAAAALVVALGACAASTQEGGSNSPTTEQAARLFPDRADAQREDQERDIGQAAMLSGYTTTVTAASFTERLSLIQTGGYIVADITVLNRDRNSQAYNVFDWKVQTPAGTVQSPTVITEGGLGSGDLVGGGTVSGKVAFEVGGAKGDFYLIYKPDPFDAARGIWRVAL